MLGDGSREPVGGDVGIDLRRGDVGVTEQGLHTAQIRAAFHQMRRESMAQNMRR